MYLSMYLPLPPEPHRLAVLFQEGLIYNKVGFLSATLVHV